MAESGLKPLIRAAGGLTNLMHTNGCGIEDLMKECGDAIDPIVEAVDGDVEQVVCASGGLEAFKKALKDDLAEVMRVAGGLPELIQLAGGGEGGLANVVKLAGGTDKLIESVDGGVDALLEEVGLEPLIKASGGIENMHKALGGLGPLLEAAGNWNDQLPLHQQA